MNENEAHPRAAAMLADAGWKPHDTWGVYTRGTLVMGGDLLGGFHVKDWGMDIHGPDTPDTPEEAAEWLVQRFAIPADVVTFADAAEPESEHDDPSAPDSGGAGAGSGDASLSGEPDTGDAGGDGASAESAGNGAGGVDETHGETGEEANGEPQGAGPDHASGAESGYEPGSAGIGLADSEEPIAAEGPHGDDQRADSGHSASGGRVYDADFSPVDLPEIELIEPDPNPDFGAELLDWSDVEEPDGKPLGADAAGAFIFGDNLHQMRTAAIGLVMQHALALMPEPTDYARLSELRNFTLGVSEDRWPDDPAKREELDVLEATERRRHQLAMSRDEKVGFLMTADREAIEAFDCAAGWP